ncbi:hypothetical protein VTH82DRAFT_8376 [Thermothelomyces myriococcoides]
MPRKAPELDPDFNLPIDGELKMDGETSTTAPPSTDEGCETAVPDAPEGPVMTDTTVDAGQTAVQDAAGDTVGQQGPEQSAPEGDIAPLDSEGPANEVAAQPEVEASEQEPTAEQPEASAEGKSLEEPPAPEEEGQPAQPPAADQSTEDTPTKSDGNPEANGTSDPQQADVPLPGTVVGDGVVAESGVPQGEQAGDAGPQFTEESEPADVDGQAKETEAMADRPVDEHMSAPETPAEESQDNVSHSSRPLSRQSGSHAVRHIPSRSTSSDEAGDSSSHNGRDDDVFSLRSTRSSLCSLENEEFHTKTPQADESHSRRESYSSTLHHAPHHHSSPSPGRNASNLSSISGFSQYDNDYYDSDLSPKNAYLPYDVPYDATIKPTKPNTRRMPFRTPSEIRAMQMSSPTPSVFNGSSPVRRSPGSGKRSSLSRLGSPSVSAQYSPKGRSTPPRFKSAPPQEAPLVLLHVTLLPLRWAWAGVLESMDSVAMGGKAAGEEAFSASPESGSGLSAAAAALRAFQPSDQLKSLRDAWRELQDRMGDTVLERGILLPHPQSDYEVLEERLLEALELPLRRRARILECGHYIGPANVDPHESIDDYGYDDEKQEEKSHWCNTCCGEIRYEDLGPGKVFRVKVYASNGLMKAGAWEACWKEMERVDVELEPIVDLAVQNELEKLAMLQMELEEQRRRELEMLDRAPDSDAAELRRESPATFDQGSRGPSRQQSENHSSEAEFVHEDAQRATMSSRASSSGMQPGRSTSSPQPSASTTFMRADTPTTYPIDTSEERRLRDEERMREIYGDNPPPPPPAPAAEPTQIPASAAPAEQAQQQQQQQQQAHYQQPQHAQSQALSTVVTPPSMPLLADAPYRHHPQHDPYHPNPYDDPYDQRGRRQSQHQRPPARSIVVDENSGFVELLMEAFKVLLRDPKNVAIIVLCLFLVVLMKRPGGVLQQQQQQPPLPAPPPAHQQQQQEQQQQQQQQQQQPPVVQVVVPPASGPAGGYQMDTQLGAQGRDDAQAVPKADVVVTPPSVNTPAMEYVEEVLASMAEPEVADGLGSLGAAAEPAAVVAKDVEHVDTVQEPQAESAGAEAAQAEKVSTTPAEQAVEAEEAKTTTEEEDKAPALALSIPKDVCPLPGLEYPITLVGEVPGSDEVVAEEDRSQVAQETVTQPEEAVSENIEKSADSFEPVETVAKAVLEQDDSADNCDNEADVGQEEEEAVNAVVPTSASLAADSAAPTSSATFLSGPLVTERKTVRVFETVTETVRVSVVTQTETVSTVVTAIPQTVEETVFETETVRITVSVPVEEQKQQQQQKQKKAQPSKGCKRSSWF